MRSISCGLAGGRLPFDDCETVKEPWQGLAAQPDGGAPEPHTHTDCTPELGRALLYVPEVTLSRDFVRFQPISLPPCVRILTLC